MRGERGRRWCGEQPHGRTRTGTDGHGPQAWAMVLPGTLWRGQNAEVRGQGEPNSQQPFNARGANETQTTQAIFWGRGAQAGAKGRSAALSTPAQGRWMGWEGGGRGTEEPSALNERSYRTAELAFPVTWNLEPETEGNSPRTNTDGHGQARIASGGDGFS